MDWVQYLPPPVFRVLPRRWVVERTFAWQSHARRLSKDYELLCSTSEAFIYVCMIRLMLRRLTRRGRFFRRSLIGTLLKAQIEIEGLAARDGLQQRPEFRRQGCRRPRPPAAVHDAPGIKPALHLPQRARPRRWTRWRPHGVGAPALRGPLRRDGR